MTRMLREYVADWRARRWVKAFLDGKLDRRTDRVAKTVLIRMRLAYMMEPYVNPVRQTYTAVRLILEKHYGGHRQTGAQVHGGSNAVPGAGAGTIHPAPTALTPGGFSYFPIGAPTGRGSAGTGTPWIGEVVNEGVKAGEILAHRCWRLLSLQNLLESTNFDYVWLPGEPARGNPESPPEGIYAFKHNSGPQWESYTMPVAGLLTVVGTVWLYGTIVEHEFGYRAEFARVASIADHPDLDMTPVRELYGVGKDPPQ